MPVYKDEARDEWFVQTAYHNSDGKRVRTTKRGFAMKREAQVWEADFLAQHEGSLDMTFARFYELYEKDCGPRLKLNTRLTKEALVKSKIMPFFGSMQMSQISPSDVIRWQNGLLAAGTDSGEPYSRCYLRTISNQLSAIFNHAVRFYGLRDNPMSAIHRMGQARGAEMKFWTKDEYLAFAEQIQDKPISFTAFEILYWTGIREGELLALTPADIDLSRHTLRVTKSYQRLQGKDVITSPKTPRSVRTIALPRFLCDEIAEFEDFTGTGPDDRLFPTTKNFLYHEMQRGSEAAGVKRIRIHDLRHSHVSLLIEMGFSVLAIAERMGHESVDITYRYAHLFPDKQRKMADGLEVQRGAR